MHPLQRLGTALRECRLPHLNGQTVALTEKACEKLQQHLTKLIAGLQNASPDQQWAMVRWLQSQQATR